MQDERFPPNGEADIELHSRCVVGIGWHHTSGSIGHGFSASELGFAGFTGVTGEEKLGVDFKTNVFEARAQASKTLLIFTPYLGLTGYYARAESSYEIADEKGGGFRPLLWVAIVRRPLVQYLSRKD